MMAAGHVVVGKEHVGTEVEFLTNDVAVSRGQLGIIGAGLLYRQIPRTAAGRLPDDGLPARSVAQPPPSRHATVRSVAALTSQAGVGAEFRSVDRSGPVVIA